MEYNLDELSFLDSESEYITSRVKNFMRFSNYIAPNSAYWLASLIPKMEYKNGEAAVKYIENLYCCRERFDYTLYTIVHMALILLIRNNEETEYQIHSLFKEKYSKLYDGKIVNHKNNPKHIPDAWVLKDDEYIPVEMKLYDFDDKALNQLNRYINFYNCKHGIAVGSKCTVELPENIQFISIDELKSVKD